jgi:RNA polymerase sigma-70 factor, ECF subfamily
LSDPGQDQLLLRAQAGDYEAFEQLYSLLEPAITRYVRRLIGEGQACEDVVQDTFIALYMNLERISPPGNLRPYVYRIARNNCYDLLRWERRSDTVSLDDEAVGRPSPVVFRLHDENTAPPDEVTHWLLLALEVREAIDRLPAAQREALILYVDESLTYAEIAEVTGVNIGTVKSRLFHAKRTLRGLVRPEILLAIQGDIDADQTTPDASIREQMGTHIPEEMN